MPRFLERDECEREPPCEQYPVGRRAERQAVLAVPEDRGRGRVYSMRSMHCRFLRWGVPYRSVDQVVTPHFRTREPFVSMSQANVGLIRRDLLRSRRDARAAAAIPVAELVAMARPRRRVISCNDTLPLDPRSGTMQTPQDYVEQVSATTGMPFSNVRRNMLKVHGVLSKVEEVLAGLTRGLDLSRARRRLRRDERPDAQLLRAHRRAGRGAAEQLARRAFAVGAGHGLEDAAGAEARQRRAVDAAPHHPRVDQGGRARRGVRYYPTDHAGGNEILRSTGRGMVFGDVGSTKRWKADRPRRSARPRLQQGRDRSGCRGPVGAIHRRDRRIDVEQRRPLVRERVGRVGDEARATRSPRRWRRGCATVMPRAADDPEAVLAPFADPDTAQRISATIDRRHDAGRGSRRHTGARCLRRRSAAPIASRRAHGGTYLLPTVVRCDADHPLANREFLFPFASVVQVPAEELPDVPRSVAGRHLHLERSRASARASSRRRTSIA